MHAKPRISNSNSFSTFSNGQNSQERSWGRSGSNVQEAALLANTIERLPSSGKASSNVIYVKNNRNINNNGESQYDTNTNADVQRILPRANWAPTNAYPVYKSNESDNRNYLESQWNQRSQLHQIDNQNTRNWSSQRRSDQGQNHEQESEERRERQQERQWQAEAERREAAEEYKALHQDH